MRIFIAKTLGRMKLPKHLNWYLFQVCWPFELILNASKTSHLTAAWQVSSKEKAKTLIIKIIQSESEKYCLITTKNLFILYENNLQVRVSKGYISTWTHNLSLLNTFFFQTKSEFWGLWLTAILLDAFKSFKWQFLVEQHLLVVLF